MIRYRAVTFVLRLLRIYQQMQNVYGSFCARTVVTIFVVNCKNCNITILAPFVCLINFIALW